MRLAVRTAEASVSTCAMPASPVLGTRSLGFPWSTVDPFLFCVHHRDAYPKGNEEMGPAASLAGRALGQDFDGRDGWNMYHGHTVPGFPQHPHRGFETVTIARQGFIDHSDSLGATARFGKGDVQWMTAGRGVVHCEMFPLLERTQDNPAELFQIWLNLPKANKLVEPHFTMLWSETIPKHTFKDAAGRSVFVTQVCGSLGGVASPKPPPSSWAAAAENEVAIWPIVFEPGAKWTLPAAAGPDIKRTLYFFEGPALHVGGQRFERHCGIELNAAVPAELEAGDGPTEALLLQGRAIAEPVAQYGPFVMNTPQEIRQAFLDYQRTEFGGWPWRSDDPVHPRAQGRFAKHVDGRHETPPSR